MKNKTKVKISNDLINDLKKYLKEVCVGCATFCRDDLTEHTTDAINNFYADYDPLKYSRHFFNFYKNSFEKYYKNPHGQIVYGGVLLTPYNMQDIYKDEPASHVFDFVYNGFHGVSSAIHNNPSPMNPAPREEIELRQFFLSSNTEMLKNYGIQRASKGNYSTIEIK
jgi:hypothetical protein